MKPTMILFAIFLALAAFAADPPAGTIQIDAASLAWKDGPPSLTKGTKVAVLEGDPKSAGMFTMRLRVPAGGRVLPHWHPRPERVTILSGEVKVGFGDVIDEKNVHAFHAGDFYVNPALSHHYVLFTEESVVQITGEGPWELKMVNAE